MSKARRLQLLIGALLLALSMSLTGCGGAVTEEGKEEEKKEAEKKEEEGKEKKEEEK